jgi:hypothetical protein
VLDRERTGGGIKLKQGQYGQSTNGCGAEISYFIAEKTK